ncbi:ABC transporter transmembrane domain-containing protein [Pseudomarimonas salicorniae]|uniref:ABC transporter transmembrane domain-containing protein n=1 Tax=Pseudomarimonas salicorniae TaxID=2933270 RepID=A0ABT0GGM1_9GAMM|nr:ABC transporter transmembrane domain-containing protein [Lysobacter sp. CAU 1642]MCK7593160.1 ABC transporter transmembrane domain-containing protein [Lysobacter sp. CAU 1642]
MGTESTAADATPRPRPWQTLAALWPLLSEQRRLLALWLGFLALSSVATLSLPVAVRYMIDRGFAGDDPSAIDRWFLGLFGVAALLAVATAGRFFAVSLLGEKVVAALRRRLYDHLLALDIAFYDRSRSGELVSRLSADSEQIRSMVGSSLSIALRSVVTLLGSAVMLVATSPRLAAMAMVGIPLVVLPIVLFGRRVQAVSQQSQERIAEANARAAETLSAMSTVRGFARERFESQRFAEAVERALRTARKRIRTQSLLTASVILLVFGAITAVLWLGAKDVVAGRLSAGVLSQFVLYAVLGAGSVGALSEVWAEVQRTAGGLARIRQLLDEVPAVVAPPQPQALPARLRGAVSFRDVRFCYPSRPDQPALDGFSLDIAEGETVALVGPSGAGKSTVLQLLLRLYDPQQGELRIDGLPLVEIDPSALRQQLAVVPQHPVIFAASARDNIRYGALEADDAAVEQAARLAEAHGFLSALPEGFDTWLGERGARLSGGQQQRIAIARAVLKDAPVLLLDEATSALDAASEQSIQQALERLVQGRTTIVVAHRLATVRRADRIVVMEHGRIVAQGRHEALLAAGGLYAELARLQFVDG